MSPRRVTIDELEQLAQSRAHWRVVDISHDHAVVDICACTGEPMERVESGDPAVISYLRTAHPEFDAS
jgi:hypothetical protein